MASPSSARACLSVSDAPPYSVRSSMSSDGASPPEAASVSTIEIQIQTLHIDMDRDLIIEILLRLPVKSIVRFKAVCKLWRSLISDPLFASLHFQRAAPSLLFADSHAIRTIDLEGPLQSHRVSQPINCHFLSNYHDLSLPRNCISIHGSCRGFLLITWIRNIGRRHPWNDSLYLWNPSTHVHKPILSSPVVDTNVFDHLYGFGYHSSTDDYLVVRVPVTDSRQPTHLPDVQFFSLRANMWKYAEGVDLPPLTTIFTSTGLLFNEAIHWVVTNWVDGVTTMFIIAFDLMEKRLLEIPMPHGLLFPCFELWVHGRFLSLSIMQRDGTCEIWVMKKYKVQTSWTKTLVLSTEIYHFPICSTKGGDIVIYSGSKVKKYSGEGVEQEEQLEYPNHCGLLDASVPIYTESMLSLPDVSD
ncbi:F-box/kelch-repeat protein At3g23880-like [Lotus japonicus]|uniref:F-box/kelch-repeat protein At3g23880-like n=1 Tax=Lotus japonicus TaxID=34305 RepID=UPI0025844B7D|nr:F-box/kelch-repeat protein At3g23880-like [Lotus japonicus]XP_057434712.1 F-box/kelch-repeat protein At3g23880-like [Lotus japonicus]XP_057434714.1 F-box/kelch-repeat protein At3g23880-like [Lotus japonicus]XP_057434715.1 F-box/kelch-repeat protein At3g23880-like [Lotus japonicus]